MKLQYLAQIRFFPDEACAASASEIERFRELKH
jgi:hypothetical protein